jgi:hypothetical protein
MLETNKVPYLPRFTLLKDFVVKHRSLIFGYISSVMLMFFLSLSLNTVACEFK